MKQKTKRTLSLVTMLILVSLACSFLADSTPASEIQTDRTMPAGLAAPIDVILRDFKFLLPLFNAESAWNQKIDQAPILPQNEQQILVTYQVLRGDNSTLHPSGSDPGEWPFMFVNLDEYSIPISRMGTSEQSVLICDYEGHQWWPSPKFPDDQQEGGPISVPGPAGTVRPSGPQDTGADGHLVLYNPDTFMAYDYWQATTQRDSDCDSLGGGLTGDQILEAGAVDFFDIREEGANFDTYSSARATGTPLLAGLLIPEDVASGEIAHALAVAIPGLRNLSPNPDEPLPSDYFYPATTTETDFYNTNPNSMAAGQRLRLRSTLVDEGGNPLDENQLAPITQMYLEALRTYGAILIDNSGGLTFYTEDIHTANLDLTLAEVNALIGESPGTPLPVGKTKWQTVIERLDWELELIPFAYGPWEDGNDPTYATIEIANFEVVDPSSIVEYSNKIYLPVISDTPISSLNNNPLRTLNLKGESAR